MANNEDEIKECELFHTKLVSLLNKKNDKRKWRSLSRYLRQKLDALRTNTKMLQLAVKCILDKAFTDSCCAGEYCYLLSFLQSERTPKINDIILSLFQQQLKMYEQLLGTASKDGFDEQRYIRTVVIIGHIVQKANMNFNASENAYILNQILSDNRKMNCVQIEAKCKFLHVCGSQLEESTIYNNSPVLVSNCIVSMKISAKSHNARIQAMVDEIVMLRNRKWSLSIKEAHILQSIFAAAESKENENMSPRNHPDIEFFNMYNVNKEKSSLSISEFAASNFFDRSSGYSLNSYILSNNNMRLLVVVQFKSLASLNHISLTAKRCKVSNKEDVSPPQRVHLYKLSNIKRNKINFAHMIPDKSFNCTHQQLHRRNGKKIILNWTDFEHKAIAIYIESNCDTKPFTYLHSIHYNGTKIEDTQIIKCVHGELPLSEIRRIRIYRKTACYVTGLPSKLRSVHLKDNEWFGKYGKVCYVNMSSCGSAHIVFESESEAMKAMNDCNQNRKLIATFSFHYYCRSFLRNTKCTKLQCGARHSWCSLNEVVTKRDDDIKREESRNTFIHETNKTNECALKFKDWLKETDGLIQYLIVFEQNGWNDITMIQFLDENIVKNELGINNQVHIELLLRRIAEFKQLLHEFNEILKACAKLNEVKDMLNRNGIITLLHLRKDMKTLQEVKRILGIKEDKQAEEMLKLIDNL